MSVVLGIDTSTQVSAGVARDGVAVASIGHDGSRRHVEELMPAIDEALAQAGCSLGDVDRIAVGVGPGPFTGLRVGIVTAQVLGATLGVPVTGVCSLDVVAAEMTAGPEEFVVVSDARRKELYWARYRGGARVGEPQVSAPAEVPALPVVGPASRLYPDVIGDRVVDGPTRLDAGVLAAAVERLSDAGLAPLYLRRPDASTPSRRKSALGPAKAAR